jgi:hypothetical protein
MKIHGYCERCHKIKRINAGNAAMVNLAMNKPVFGLCDACLEAEQAASRARHPAYRHRTP